MFESRPDLLSCRFGPKRGRRGPSPLSPARVPRENGFVSTRRVRVLPGKLGSFGAGAKWVRLARGGIGFAVRARARKWVRLARGAKWVRLGAGAKWGSFKPPGGDGLCSAPALTCHPTPRANPITESFPPTLTIVASFGAGAEWLLFSRARNGFVSSLSLPDSSGASVPIVELSKNGREPVGQVRRARQGALRAWRDYHIIIVRVRHDRTNFPRCYDGERVAEPLGLATSRRSSPAVRSGEPIRRRSAPAQLRQGNSGRAATAVLRWKSITNGRWSDACFARGE